MVYLGLPINSMVIFSMASPVVITRSPGRIFFVHHEPWGHVAHGIHVTTMNIPAGSELCFFLMGELPSGELT